MRGCYGQPHVGASAEGSNSSAKTLLFAGSVAVIGLWLVGELSHKRRARVTGWIREKREWVPAPRKDT